MSTNRYLSKFPDNRNAFMFGVSSPKNGGFLQTPLTALQFRGRNVSLDLLATSPSESQTSQHKLYFCFRQKITNAHSEPKASAANRNESGSSELTCPSEGETSRSKFMFSHAAVRQRSRLWIINCGISESSSVARTSHFFIRSPTEQVHYEGTRIASSGLLNFVFASSSFIKVHSSYYRGVFRL